MRQALLPRRQWSWRTRLKRVRRRSVRKLWRGRRRPARRSRKQYLNLVAGNQVGQQGRSLKAALFCVHACSSTVVSIRSWWVDEYGTGSDSDRVGLRDVQLLVEKPTELCARTWTRS